MIKILKNKFNIQQLFILFILSVLTITLAACTNDGNTTDTPSKEDDDNDSAYIDEAFAELENEFDAALGVYAIDTSSNETIEYQPEKRFAFASTYKALAAAVLLQQHSMEELEEVVTFTAEDLVPYSPVTEEHVDDGMSLLDLAEAAVRHSDNTAGNLIYEAIGGPEGLEEALNQIGDDVTRADRFEPDLNIFTPGEAKDTSTPKALVTSLQAFTVEEALSEEERELLNDWLQGNATGDTLIRAGAPEDWIVGDKSGAANYGTRNDIAVILPPDNEPIVIAIMSCYDTEDAEFDDALIAKAAEITLDALK